MANENDGGIVVTSPKELTVPNFNKQEVESIALGVASKKNVYKFKAVVVGSEDDSYISLPLQSIKGLPKAIYVKGKNINAYIFFIATELNGEVNKFGLEYKATNGISSFSVFDTVDNGIYLYGLQAGEEVEVTVICDGDYDDLTTNFVKVVEL